MRIRPSRIRFEELEARFLASNDDSALDFHVPEAKRRGYLTKPELLAVCRWKSPRPLRIVRRNLPRDVEQVTACALLTTNERLRIGSLLMLQGISWPMASVLLHFFHSDPYPILDYRAVESVGLERPSSYSFEFWWRYVLACRRLSSSLRLSMRAVDRALWQHSKEKEEILAWTSKVAAGRAGSRKRERRASRGTG